MKISEINFTLFEEVFEAGRPAEKKEMTDPKDTLFIPSVESRFDALCRHYPERIALADERERLSFKRLDSMSRDISAFINAQGLKPEGSVGVMCERSVLFVAAFLGIIRAGGVYVPLDPALPMDRRKLIVSDSKASLLITDKINAGDARKLAYACPALSALLCLNTPRFEDAVERPGNLMSIELWNHVSQSTPDGSWKSYFTGAPLSGKALTGLALNLLNKTRSKLGAESRILDIGSGSGQVAQMLMANCHEYTCIDLSRYELDRAEETATVFEGLTIHVHQMEAIDIHLLNLENYDLVVLNSVIENFPGYNYLEKALDRSLEILADDGLLFAGSIWDPDQRDRFLCDLETHAEKTGDFSGMIRLSQGEELFVPRTFFNEWARKSPWQLSIDVSTPEIDEPELTRYRYDVVIRKKGLKTTSNEPARYFGQDHLKTCAGADKKRSSNIPRLNTGRPPHTALYMIYTSGTTGRPKGVVVEQSGFINLFEALEQTVYGNAKPLNLALMASFSFDASLQHIAATLLGGHTLNIVPDTVKTDPKALNRYLEQRRIDICDGTPSLFALLTDYCRDHAKSCSVTTFLLGGEPLKSDILARYFDIDAHRQNRIVNAYGPTECSVDATLFEITNENHNAYGTPPIGYALPNTRITVRGKRGEILPPGMAGELWISGKGLARGYYNDPVLTAARFIDYDGKRWYRTGDIGRHLKDGLLFFAGREDAQVKVGGFRVELGEVEAALNACPLIANAVVKAGDFSGNGVNTLACYFIPKGSSDISAIRGYLKTVLPQYAIPSHYIPMNIFPLSGNGKIDLHSLPSPLDASKAAADASELPIVTPAQLKIAQLWEALLGRTPPAANCDFFEMGGHSILAVRLIGQLEKTFGKRLSLFDLYQASTITAQAELMDQEEKTRKPYHPIITFSDTEDGSAIFLFHPVGGHALRYRFLAGLLAPNFSVYGIQAPGVEQDMPWLLEVEEMAQLYLSRILDQAPRTPLVFAGWSFGGLVAFETACCLERRTQRMANVILLDSVADNRIAKQTVAENESAMLERLFTENIGFNRAQIEHYKGRERLDYLVDLGVKNGVLPSGFNRDHMRRLLQIYNGNALASARYTPGIYRGDGLLIRPSQITESAMTIPDDPMQGWKGHFEQGLELKWMDGNHESMLSEHGSHVVRQHILAYLRKG